MVVDKNNDLLVCGQMDGDFNPGNVKITGKNNFLIKYSSAGSILWAKALPGLVCKSISADRNGNPCVAGYFSDTVQIGKFTLASNGLNDFFVAKFDSLGNILWANSGGGDGNDMALAVTCDVEGNTNITGSFESFMNFNSYTSLLSLGKGDMFVAQYDTAGHFFWAANGGGNGADAGTAIGSDLYGDVFVTGYFNASATFHNNHVKSTGGKNMYIIKYSPLGYQLSIQTINCGGSVVPNAIGLDGSGNVYICGTFNGTAIFDDRSLASKGDDGFVVAYDNALNIKWLNLIGGPGNDAALGIAADWTSNIFVTGVFTGSADFSGSSLTSQGLADIFIVKYDAAGRVLWKQQAGGAGADSSFSICVDRGDIPSIMGTINNKADFGEFILNADDSGSIFIAQMKTSPTGINIQNNNNAALFEIYPNPSWDIFNIKETGLINEPVMIKLTDAAGKIILVKNQIPGMNKQIDLQYYSDGIYFLTIFTANGCYTEKLIKSSY